MRNSNFGRCMPRWGVVTGDATEVTSTSAFIIGNRLININNVQFVGIEYGTDPCFSCSQTEFGEPDSIFNVDIEGLLPGTTYYYRAFAANRCKTYLGDIQSFTTELNGAGNVVTGTATNITETGATIINNIYSDITEAITGVAVEYDVNSSFTTSTVVSGVIGNPFNVSLSGLTPNTLYYYRAVVFTTSQTIYGDVKTFMTSGGGSAGSVTTGSVGNLTTSSATINNNMYNNLQGTPNSVSVSYSTDPTLAGGTTVPGTIANPFSVNLTGLNPGTTYYYRAVVATTSDVYNGAILSFTTPVIVP